MELERFRQAQKYLHMKALQEVRNGEKEGHWMWFEFPQVLGLGESELSQYYGLRGLEEARAYLHDTELRENLEEMCNALLVCKTNKAEQIFGELDAKKLWSSMTIFAIASESEESIYHNILERYYGRKYDEDTLKVLHNYYRSAII